MRSIGLIGGMSFESTIVYYKVINEMVRERLGAGHSARIVLESLDFADIIACQKAGDWDGAADILSASAGRLEQAGADCVLICTNTMHLVADQVAGRINAPLINIIARRRRNCRPPAGRSPCCWQPLHDGTRLLRRPDEGCRHRHHGSRPGGRDLVHSVIFDELCCGIIRPEIPRRADGHHRDRAGRGRRRVILGCTRSACCLIPMPCRFPALIRPPSMPAPPSAWRSAERGLAARMVMPGRPGKTGCPEQGILDDDLVRFDTVDHLDRGHAKRLRALEDKTAQGAGRINRCADVPIAGKHPLHRLPCIVGARPDEFRLADSLGHPRLFDDAAQLGQPQDLCPLSHSAEFMRPRLADPPGQKRPGPARLRGPGVSPDVIKHCRCSRTGPGPGQGLRKPMSMHRCSSGLNQSCRGLRARPKSPAAGGRGFG